MSGLEERVDDVERLVDQLSREVGAMQAGSVPRGARPESADVPWSCAKCGGMLALYDQAADVLRIRYKDLYVHTRVGRGGFIQVICRQCGEVNVQDYVDEEAASADPRAVEVVRRR